MSNDATSTKAGGMRNYFSKLGQRPTIMRHYPTDQFGWIRPVRLAVGDGLLVAHCGRLESTDIVL